MYLWRFYKKPDEENDEVTRLKYSVQDRYPLYALTNNKEYASIFMEERDMRKFIKKKDKIELDEYEEFANRNRSCVLEEASLLTELNKFTNKKEKSSITMIITSNESQSCQEYPNICIMDEEWWGMNAFYLNPSLYLKKFRKALHALDFDTLYKLNSYTYENQLPNMIDDDYSAPSWNIDEAAYFIFMFGDTLS